MRRTKVARTQRVLSRAEVDWLIEAVDLDCARLAAAILASPGNGVELTKFDKERFGLVGGLFYIQMRTLERNGLINVQQVTERPPHNWRLGRNRIVPGWLDGSDES